MKKAHFLAVITALSFLVVAPGGSYAQQLESLDDFNSEEHLGLSHCLYGDIGDNLSCLERSLERCRGFVYHLGTAGGANYCSYVALEEVNAHLNAIYPEYIYAARENVRGDEYADEAEAQLRAAQRAWLTYRDSMCVLNADWRYINSGYDAVIAECQARLTLIQVDVLSTELGIFTNRP